MKRVIISGPCKLNGVVKVQGAKNSTNRLSLLTLLTEGKFVIKNFPKLGTTLAMLKLIKKIGAKVIWKEKNTILIDTHSIKGPIFIPSKIFYYTSSGIIAIPSLTHRFGECRIEKMFGREDYGGCQIGNRAMEHVIATLEQCGISCKDKKKEYIFRVASDKPFVYDIPWNSYAATVNALQAALMKNGISTLKNFTKETEFKDILAMAQKMGAQIEQGENNLQVHGQKPLHGTSYTAMSDRHDFATWVSTALTTKSDIQITNISYEQMNLDALDDVAKRMNINMKYEDTSCFVYGSTSKLKPIIMKAGLYPEFQTEWQVLFAPLLTQINGKSRVIEMFYANRMQHWKELEKMGARYSFFKSKIKPAVPFSGQDKPPPNAVKVLGPIILHGAKVKAADVRAGAALVIAALAAHGETQIINIDEIKRGYEDFFKRLRKLEVEIQNG